MTFFQYTAAMSLLKSSFVVSFWTGMSRFLGFARDLVLANKLGASAASDAFFIALVLPNLIRRLFAEGAFNMAFVPMLSAHKSKSTEEAQTFASHILTSLLLVLSAITILALIFMPALVLMIAPGFRGDPEKLALTIQLGRVTFPYLMLISAAAFMGALCNTWGKFAFYAAAPALLNISFLGCLFLLPSALVPPEWAASIAVPVGGMLQVIFMWVGLQKAGIQLQFRAPKHPELKTLLRRLGPAALGVGVLQLSFLIDNFLASFLYDKAISYLQYANRFYQFPLALIGIATATVLLPHLSSALADKRKEDAASSFSMAFVGAMALGLGAFIGLFALAEELLSTLLAHGEFTTEAAKLTAWAMMGYSAGLPGYILTKLTATAFFAAGDTKTPLKAGILALGVNVIANLVLMQFFGHVGIALATALSGWVNAAFQLYMLKRSNVIALELRALMLPLTKAFGVALLMGALLMLYKTLLPYGSTLTGELLWLAGALVLGGTTFLIGVDRTHVLPIGQLLKRLMKRA